MSLLLSIARGSRRALTIAVLASALCGLCSSLLVALINHALSLEPAALEALLPPFVALGLAVPGLRWISQSQFVRLQQSTLAGLRVLVSRHIAHAPYAQLEHDGASRFMAVLVEDTGTVADFFLALPRLVMQGAVVLGAFAYLGWLSWQPLACALGMVLVGSLIHFWAVRRASHHLEQARDGEDALYAHFRALVSGSKELKLSAARREGFLQRTLAPSVAEVREHGTLGLLAYVGAGSWGAFMFFVVIGGVIFGLGSWVAVDGPVRSGFALMFLFIMFPLEDLLEAVPDLIRVRIALDRIREACGGAFPSSEASRLPEPRRSFESVQLRGVCHRYHRDAEEGEFQLGPISLTLRPAELVFVVGGNGSGKTTLAKLLVGLYEPEAGSVLLDGEPVTAAEREAYRQLFSVVFSDCHVFDAALGVGGAERDQQAAELLRTLALDHKLRVSDGVFSTTELSTGQQKRLALLIACLEDRPLCVFDEWAKDQDPAYREVFYTELLPALRARGKSVLVITHDDRYFDLADRCLKLEDGRLVARARASDEVPEQAAHAAEGREHAVLTARQIIVERGASLRMPAPFTSLASGSEGSRDE